MHHDCSRLVQPWLVLSFVGIVLRCCSRAAPTGLHAATAQGTTFTWTLTIRLKILVYASFWVVAEDARALPVSRASG